MAKLQGADSMVNGITPGPARGSLSGAPSMVNGMTGGVPANTFNHSEIHQGFSNDLGDVKVSSSQSNRGSLRGRKSAGAKPGKSGY